MIERMDELRTQAEARSRRPTRPPPSRSCACAPRAQAELPNLLRGVAELPPEQLAPWAGGQPGRQALSASSRRARRSSRRRARRAAGRRSRRRHPARQPPSRSGACTSYARRARARGHLRRPGLTVVEGPEVETVHSTSTHSITAPPTRAQPTDTSTWPTTSSCARTPRRCRSTLSRPTRRRCTSSSPGAPIAATRSMPRIANVPSGRTPGRRQGHHPRRPQGHAAGLRARSLRRGPRHAPAPTLLPFTEPRVEVDVSCSGAGKG